MPETSQGQYPLFCYTERVKAEMDRYQSRWVLASIGTNAACGFRILDWMSFPLQDDCPGQEYRHLRWRNLLMLGGGILDARKTVPGIIPAAPSDVCLLRAI